MNLDETIMALISRERIGDQATLRDRLAARGHGVTQPTLSRHLKRLGIRKEHGSYRRAEYFPTPPASGYTATRVAPNLIVLRTRPGHAQALAVLLDSQSLAGVAGTVGGDDTVLVIASEPDLEIVEERIRHTLDSHSR